MKLMATFEPNKGDFFNLPSRKIEYFKQKKEEENLGKRIASNIFKNLNKKDHDFGDKK